MGGAKSTRGEPAVAVDDRQTGEVGRFADRGNDRLRWQADPLGDGPDHRCLTSAGRTPQQHRDTHRDGKGQGFDDGRLIFHLTSLAVPGMRCCGVPGGSDPETYLRLACERTLLAQDSGRGIHEGFEGAVIRRVLTAAGALRAEVGLHVLEEYRLAMALRGGHGGHMFMHGRAVEQTQRQRLSAQRVVVGQDDFEHGTDRWRLERLLFADDNCQLKLSGTDQARARSSGRHHMVMGRPGPHGPNQPNPQTIALSDDQGTKVTARRGSSSWGGGSWEASYTSDHTLSADTRWVELDGTRLELPERQPTPVMALELIEQLEPLHAALYAEILSTDRRHGGADTVEIACQALTATGVCSDDDAMLAELRRIADAVSSASSAPGLPEPWASLVERFETNDGPIGIVPIGSAIDDLDGFSIRVDTLTSEPTSFSLAIAISPGTPLLRHFPGGIDIEASPITWWAEDDRANVFVAFADRGGGSDVVAEGLVTSLASLDPKATELRIFPTGKSVRGVLRVPLAGLSEHES